MSGGGSFGAVEVGILEKIHTNFDLISGVSVGALNACFLSYFDKNNFNIGLQNLKNIYLNLKNDDIYKPNWHFSYHNINKVGFFDTTPLHDTLEKILYSFHNKNIIPSIIGSTNLNNGNFDIFYLNNYTNKEQVDLLLTSSAIPIAFPPRMWNNSLYIDGGVISNSILKELDNFIDCDFYNITYITTADKLVVNNDIDNFGILLKRITEVLYFNFNNELFEFVDVKCLKPKGVINYCFPDGDKLKKYSILDFTKSSELINIGNNYHHCIKINYC
jgi:predicted patatin/cPLA2 family phospholipase